MKIPFPKPFTIVDVETTGGSPLGHRIIEIGIVSVTPENEISVYSSLVNPERHVAPHIFELTGIDPEALENAPVFAEIAPLIYKKLKDSLFVAHNARFDYAFLRHEFRRVDLKFSGPTLCSVNLSRKLYPEYRKHDLTSLVERHSLRMDKRHRALDDAQAVWEFFEKARKEKGDALFFKIWEKLCHTKLPHCELPLKKLESLPESPGVYIFYGQNHEVLYIGKSKNIKERVLSHFYEDGRTGRQLALTRNIKDIDVKCTAGELSALFLESKLIKSLSPLYNRRLRKKNEFVLAFKQTLSSGYRTVSIQTQSHLEMVDENLIGLYPSRRKAKEKITELARAHSLCLKVLGLEESPKEKSCFSYHLKACKGACLGKEAVINHNLRFEEAFSKTAVRKWPYASAVLIEEKDEFAKKAEAFIVRNWRILAKIQTDEEYQSTQKVQPVFDWDTYKILHHAFLKPTKGLRVRSLSEKELNAFWNEVENV